MESFIILQENINKGLYCENIAFYYLHPTCKLMAKRVSPYFLYSEEYGYIRSFDDVKIVPLVVEETAMEDYKYQVEICNKNGCHVGLNPEPLFIYYYTLTRKTRSEIVVKKNEYYQFKTGGWATKCLKQLLPQPKKLTVFRFLTVKKPFWIIVNTNDCVWKKGDSTKMISQGTMMKITKKGFHKDQKILYCEDEGYINYEHTVLLGYNFTDVSKTDTNMCFICTQKPINCSYIHGDFAHSFCCFECSKKIFTKTCPVCRLVVEKVVINYTQSFPSISN